MPAAASTHENDRRPDPRPTDPEVEGQPPQPAKPKETRMWKALLERERERRKARREQPKENWDEICFVAVKQTDERRKRNLPPYTKLVCFQRRTDTTEQGGVSQTAHRVHMLVSQDLAESAQHLEGMSQMMEEVSDTAVESKVEVKEAQKSLLKAKEPPKLTTIEYLKRIYRPNIELYTNYGKSWENGNSRRLLESYIGSVWKGDPVRLASQCVVKWKEWIAQLQK
ncbi:uncharacterized protein EV422DRAFT_531422 [Fimicolochytrium jonesii]|uniref:uncharacterized protein n=1 Tax=Fimicolochytrium jonesii TaxID=1396493 RepID=UPI0022FDD5F6|nr:uncharacterized protein EV422DRAFT_531422 [Fimicolochytrium jonesii]KAI8820566.1 hypothetical protein EV422DRAFT_531422 [Fimicolochytrium jonesii]